jgi:hypothetical protein
VCRRGPARPVFEQDVAEWQFLLGVGGREVDRATAGRELWRVPSQSVASGGCVDDCQRHYAHLLGQKRDRGYVPS